MAKGTKEPETAIVPLEEEIGSKLAQLAAEAPNVHVATSGDIMDIVARIIDAPDVEAMNRVFSNEGATNSRDLAKQGTHVRLRSLTLRPSDFPDPDTGRQGWYASFDAVNLETGEAIRVSSSSKTVVAAFVRADSLGVAEVTGRFTYGKTTDEGYTPVNFEFDV